MDLTEELIEMLLDSPSVPSVQADNCDWTIKQARTAYSPRDWARRQAKKYLHNEEAWLEDIVNNSSEKNTINGRVTWNPKLMQVIIIDDDDQTSMNLDDTVPYESDEPDTFS